MEQHRIGSLVLQRASDDAECCERCFGFAERCVQMVQQPLPACADLSHELPCTLGAIADQDILVNIGITGVEGQIAAQVIGQRVA